MTEATPAYETPFGNTVAHFEGFHDGARGGNGNTLRVTLRTASRIVANTSEAPEPDAEGNPSPEVADYEEAAADAELLVARYIWDTDAGQMAGRRSIVGSSVTWQKDPAVLSLISQAMGPYAKTEEEQQGGADDGRGYVGRARF